MFISLPKRYVLLFLLSTVPNAAANDAARHYKTQTGHKVSSSVWQIEASQSDINLVTRSDKGIINRFTITPTNQATTLWELEDPSTKTHIKASVVGASIALTGVSKGKKVNQDCNLNHPWWQAIPWHLEQMLADNTDQAKFVAIRPDNLKCYAFVAQRLAPTNKETTAKHTRIEVRLRGAYNKFWSAQYWFDAHDNKFIRYKAKHGMFAKPTIVQLQELNLSPAAE